MSLISSLCNQQRHVARMYALKKDLSDESKDNNIHLLSRQKKLNIETDPIQCHYQSAKTLNINYNHSHPSPNLQLYDKIQSSKLQYRSLLEQQINDSNNSSTRRSQNWRRKQKQLRSNKKRKNDKNSKQTKTNNWHYRNMITVRRISCHNMIDSQKSIKKYFKKKKIQNKWKKIQSNNIIENQSSKHRTFSTEFQPSSSFVKLYTSSTPLSEYKSSLSPSAVNSMMTYLIASTLNSLFQEEKFNEKMSNPMNMIGSKVVSLHDSSTTSSSLVSTQLLSDAYNQTKPNVTNMTTTIPTSDLQIDFETIDSPSVIPCLSRHPSSSLKFSQIKSIIHPRTSSNENIQDLIDQLKTCIATLNLTLQNETKSIQTSLVKKKIRPKMKLSRSTSSLSLISTSFSNENNPIFENRTSIIASFK